jgi:putative tricarboxylic transport membrane protein
MSSTSKVSAGVLLSTRLLFLYALTALALAYTVMAFGMEWRVERGQIGPGFFPRLVGGAAVVGCLVAIGRALRGRRLSPDSPVDEEGQPEEVGGGGTDAWTTAATVGCMALLFFLFEPLGALLTSVLFLGGVLTFVNRGHHVANAILSVAVPLALYLLFEVLLDAGLPEGLVAF